MANHICFVILRSNRDEREIWKRTYYSIRKLYVEPIIIIDDNSTVKCNDDGLENTTIIQSEFPGAGEVLPYYYFLKYKWASRMIFLHDSMLMSKSFSEEDIFQGKCKYLWYFFLQGCDINQKILTFLSKLKNSDLLIKTCNSLTWDSCFGVTSIIALDFLEYLEEKYNFSILVNFVKTRNDRECMERVFGIICSHEGSDDTIGGDMHSYPCVNICTYEDIINNPEKFKEYKVLKTWEGR